MRLAIALTLLALPLQAETLSQEIARTGLAATEIRLAALPTRTDAQAFTLGGVQFLRAIEGTYPERRTLCLTDHAAKWLDAAQATLGTAVMGGLDRSGTGSAWLAVLSDLDAVPTGEKLVPWRRIGRRRCRRNVRRPAPDRPCRLDPGPGRAALSSNRVR